MLPKIFCRPGRPVVLGHRGAPFERPENTLDSFLLALAQGADGVELDVLRCASGEIVVLHDPHLARLAGCDLEVRRAPWTLLRALDVGSHLSPRFASARIPRLTDVLDALPPQTLVNVELKGDGRPDPRLAVQVAKLLRAASAPERFLVSSFDPLLLAAFRLAAPELPTGWLFAEDQRFAGRRSALGMLLGARALHPSVALCTPSALARWRRQRFGLSVWTVDDPQAAHTFFEGGAEIVITNQPAAVRAAFG